MNKAKIMRELDSEWCQNRRSSAFPREVSLEYSAPPNESLPSQEIENRSLRREDEPEEK
jgi:hypothetical protein